MWKAGQCVTINRKRYRVIKAKSGCCIYCDFKHEEASNFPCTQCCEGKLMMPKCALTRIWTLHDFGCELTDKELQELEDLERFY